MENSYTFRYYGKAFSLNDFYSQGHWYRRNKIKNEYGDRFHELIETQKVTPFKTYKLTLYYNSNHDPSNVIGMVKVFEDTLRGGYSRKTKEFKYPVYVEDDSKFYCKGIEIVPDLSLRKGTFIFKLDILDAEV